MFRRLLIANRGEIALRVLRTAREMGIECVVVHSDPDAQALHARMADVAVPLEGRLPADIYLRVDKILAAAKRTGARGFIDDVIEPRETRGLLIRSLELLKTKRKARPSRKHGNIPL